MLLSDIREIVADGNNRNSYYEIELFTERQNFIILRVNQIEIERNDYYYLQTIKCFDKFGNLITELLAEDIHEITIKTM